MALGNTPAYRSLHSRTCRILALRAAALSHLGVRLLVGVWRCRFDLLIGSGRGSLGGSGLLCGRVARLSNSLDGLRRSGRSSLHGDGVLRRRVARFGNGYGIRRSADTAASTGAAPSAGASLCFGNGYGSVRRSGGRCPWRNPPARAVAHGAAIAVASRPALARGEPASAVTAAVEPGDVYAAVSAGVRQQRQEARPLDRDRQLSLMARVRAGATAGIDLAPVGDEPAQDGNILVVWRLLLSAEITDLAPGEVPPPSGAPLPLWCALHPVSLLGSFNGSPRSTAGGFVSRIGISC